MLLICHRAPPSESVCAQWAAAGATVFEVDVRAVHGELVVTHFLPFLTALPQLQHDGWAIRWQRLRHRDVALTTALGYLPDGAEVLLDLKDETARTAPVLTDLIGRSVPEPDRYYVSSKNPRSLAELRRKGFRTWRSVDTRRSLAAVLRAGAAADDAVTVRHTLLDPTVLANLRQVSRQVITWTVNDPVRATNLAVLGVDGMVTDDTAVLRALMS